jgi:hypothetical protein
MRILSSFSQRTRPVGAMLADYLNLVQYQRLRSGLFWLADSKNSSIFFQEPVELSR